MGERVGVLKVYKTNLIQTLINFGSLSLSSVKVQEFSAQWDLTLLFHGQQPATGFSRQYWSGLPFPSPGDLPSPGIKLGSPALHVDSLPSEPPGKPNLSRL